MLSTIGLAVVLYLAWASYFQLHTVCLFCATTYIAVVAIFILSGGALTVPLSDVAASCGSVIIRSLVQQPGRCWPLVLLLVVGIGVAIGPFPRERRAVARSRTSRR